MGGFAGMGPVLNGAASQFDRRLDGPAPETVRVDGRSLADLLVFAAEYGRLINFYDLTDKADGDWTEFFASDPSIAFALLVSLDLSCVERQLRRDLRDLRRRSGRDSDRHPWHRLSTALRRLIHLLDRGHAPLWTGGAALARGIRKDIRMELAPRLRSLAIHLADGGAESGFRLDLGELSGVWSIFPGLAEPAAGPPVNRVWFECLVPLLEDLVDALLAALGRVAADARKALEETLLTDDHAPQTALYIAFAELFRHAQRTVNGFSHRLVDFYDARILRQHDRATVPGEVYLTFTTAQGVTSTVIPVGTLFPAGTDDTGAPINYAASDSLPVHAVTLSELRTLQVAEGLLVARGNSPTDTPVRTGVFTGTVALSDQPPAIETPFPLFGDKVAGTTGVLTTTPATLGFAVASDTLMLTGGARSVTVGLTVTSDSLAVVTPLLESIAPQAGNVDWPTLLAQILQAAFSLSYSTGGGWVPIPGYTVTPPAARSEDMSASAGGDITFTLTFSLDDGAAPFIALSTAPVSADAVAPPADMSAPVQDLPALPTLRAIFRQDSVTVGQGGQTVTIFPYAVLWPVRLSGLSIAVSVKGFTNLTLSSPSGLLDAGTPFALFGSPPVQGASLDIAAPELFVKRLGSLDLSLGWFGLPQTTTGFQGYYQGYVVNPDGDTVPPGTLFTNQSFQTTLCVINPGWWTLALPAGDTDAQPSYLFRTDIGNAVPTADEPALPETAFDGLPVTDTEPPASYDPAAGAIRLSLVAPTYAFGDTLYASNVMAAALREMPAASACADLCARQCAHLAEVAAAAGLLDPVQTANADASDDQYAASVSSAVDKALSSLTGVALKMVDDGLATLTPEEAGAWQDSLAIALSQSGSGGRRKLLQRLFGNGKRPTPSTVCASLQEWIATNADAIGATAQGDLARARSTLDAAGRIADTRALTSDQPPAVARPVLGAALLGARSDLTQPYADALQDCLAKCQGGSSDKYYPNQPWLPTASAVSLNYTAADVLPDSPGGAYGYILPFGGTALVAWKVGDTVSLLAPIEQPGALYIGLDGVPEGKPPTLTLLFQLSDVIVGEVTDSATVSWAESFDKGWSALVAPDGLQCDGTDGMRHS
ncbi:MAG TPA: hypothetical protein VEB64_15850, partial [Azospirillaceae bacterium]|nr:hypothetical protein [Azospirillaceae bacterium]